jgi:hypothetical protein
MLLVSLPLFYLSQIEHLELANWGKQMVNHPACKASALEH